MLQPSLQRNPTAGISRVVDNSPDAGVAAIHPEACPVFSREQPCDYQLSGPQDALIADVGASVLARAESSQTTEGGVFFFESLLVIPRRGPFARRNLWLLQKQILQR